MDDSNVIFNKWMKIFSEERRKKEVLGEPKEEQVAEGTGMTPRDYRTKILEILGQLPPEGFERLSQRLLRESGFVEVVIAGRSGDGGIDGHGTLQINPLVSFRVLFQCKRYSGVEQ